MRRPSKDRKTEAYDYLFEEIVSYRLLPDDAIVEQDVAQLLGISRTPVRAALERLEADGLVFQIPSKGTFVRGITPNDIDEVFEIRELLETAALKKAIHMISDAQIDALEMQLVQLNQDSGKEEYYSSDRDLHTVIMLCSGNRRMINLHKNIESQLERLRRVSSMRPERLLKSKDEHIAILNAIRARDLEQATTCLNVHLNNIQDSILYVCKSMLVR